MSIVTFCIYIDNRPDLNPDKIGPFIEKEAARILPIINQLNEQANLNSGNLKFNIWYWLVPNQISNERNQNQQPQNQQPQSQQPELSEDDKVKDTLDATLLPINYQENLRLIEELFLSSVIGRIDGNLKKKVTLSNFAELQVTSKKSSRRFLLDDEIKYLKNVAPSPGNTLDLMKFKAIIYYTHPDLNFSKTNNNTLVDKTSSVDHLLLDSSLIIRDYAEFYRVTFLRQKLQFMINVYAEKIPALFSINNKIMYIPERNRFAGEICERYRFHIRDKELENPFRSRNHQKIMQRKTSLYLYTDVFLTALKGFELLYDNSILFAHDREQDPFLVTRFVNAKREQSWNPYLSQSASDQKYDALKKIRLDEGLVDWHVFSHLLKKHSAILVADKNEIEHRELMTRYADIDYEKSVIKHFLKAAYAANSAETIDFINHQRHRLIPQGPAIPAKHEDNQLNNIENNENSLRSTDLQSIDNIEKNDSAGIATQGPSLAIALATQLDDTLSKILNELTVIADESESNQLNNIGNDENNLRNTALQSTDNIEKNDASGIADEVIATKDCKQASERNPLPRESSPAAIEQSPSSDQYVFSASLSSLLSLSLFASGETSGETSLKLPPEAIKSNPNADSPVNMDNPEVGADVTDILLGAA
jgi:hypothetical protein